MGRLSCESPYLSDQFTVSQYGEHIVKIVYHKSLMRSGWEFSKSKPRKGSVNEEKLDCNVSRTRSAVREYVLCNPWAYWCTLTVSPQKHDRYDLEGFKKELSEFFHNLNRRRSPENKLVYLLVPEMHRDGAWHMHGFLNGLQASDLYVNENGYLGWKKYENKFGFISIDPIRDIDRASSYVTKYITKDLQNTVKKINAHSFYASHGLSHATRLYSGSASFKGEYDWEHPDGFCKIKNVDLRREAVEDFLEIPARPSEPDTAVIAEPEVNLDICKPVSMADSESSLDFEPPLAYEDGFILYCDFETGEILPTPFDDIRSPYGNSGSL